MVEKEKYLIWWDEKEKVVRAQALGILDEKAAQGIREETERMAVSHDNKLDWLIDLCQMTKATSKARKILVEASSHPSIRKYAFFGASVFIRTVVNFISSAARQMNTKHFATEEEALKWIKEDE